MVVVIVYPLGCLYGVIQINCAPGLGTKFRKKCALSLTQFMWWFFNFVVLLHGGLDRRKRYRRFRVKERTHVGTWQSLAVPWVVLGEVGWGGGSAQLHLPWKWYSLFTDTSGSPALRKPTALLTLLELTETSSLTIRVCMVNKEIYLLRLSFEIWRFELCRLLDFIKYIRYVI